MNNKSIQSVLILIVIFYIIISLCACNKDDNPVSPTPPTPPPPVPDTADRYIWSHYSTVRPTFIYAADTDRVYMICEGRLQLFDGKYINIINLNYQNFYADNVYGYDKNNVFVIGAFWINGKRYPGLKKISGGSYTDYNWNDTGAYLFDMFVTGQNQLWISALYTGKVYYFDNGSIKKYIINNTDSLLYEFFYKGKDNSFYIFAMKSSNEQNGYFYTYKYVNDNFELLSSEYLDDFPYLYRCGQDIVMRPYHSLSLKYFDGNGWIYHSTLEFYGVPVKFGGVSKDSLVTVTDIGRIITYGYAGWRKEKYMWNMPTSHRLQDNVEAKFGNIYFTIWGSSKSSDLMIGKPNKKLKI